MTQSEIPAFAEQLIERRMARDREVALSAGCPALLMRKAYERQAWLDAVVTAAHNPEGPRHFSTEH